MTSSRVYKQRGEGDIMKKEVIMNLIRNIYIVVKEDNYVKGDFECPVLKVINNNNGVVGYLEPFRWYSFQVSGSRRGEGSFGESRAVMFKLLERECTAEEFKEKLLKLLAECMTSFSNTGYGYPGFELAFSYKGECQYYGWDENKKFDVIIDIESLDWVDSFINETIRCFKKYYGIAA